MLLICLFYMYHGRLFEPLMGSLYMASDIRLTVKALWTIRAEICPALLTMALFHMPVVAFFACQDFRAMVTFKPTID